MTRKQLVALFTCNLIPFIVGNSLLPNLPAHVIGLGGDEFITGIYLSLSFGTLAIGALISGWLSDRFQRRKLTIMLAGGLSIPAALLMSSVQSIVLLTLLTMIVWFMGGLMTATVNILAGMYAHADERGRIFGILGSAGGLAQIIAGFASGRIVDSRGIGTLFTVVGVIWVITILAGFLIDDSKSTRSSADMQTVGAPLGITVWLIIGAQILAVTVGSSLALGQPLAMGRLGFKATDITSPLAVSGIVTLPIPFLIGWLSDKIGRKQLLLATYIAGFFSTITLAFATELWQFWIAQTLSTVCFIGVGVGLAYITDIVAPESLGTALSRYSAAPWIAGVIGYSTTGFFIRNMGLQGTFLMVAALPAIATAVLLSVRPRVQAVATA